MKSSKAQTNKKGRIYSVEFLRVFFILSIFVYHVGKYVDESLKEDILVFFHSKSWALHYGVECFFIIGGFFLYRSIAKTDSICFVSSIGRLWMRLMPGLIFWYVILVICGIGNWWDFPFAFFPTWGYGMARPLLTYADWYVGVYFIVSCFFISLFALSRKGAWIFLCTLAIICWCLQTNMKPLRGRGAYDVYYGCICLGLVRGLSCMALGVTAAYLSKLWNLRKTLTLMLFNFMFRTSTVHYSPLAVQLVFASFLISASHSWGYISAFFNRMSGIMYISRYTYSLFLVQSVLISYFRLQSDLGLNGINNRFIIFGSAIPLVLIEYHFIEKWLVPKLKLFFIKEPIAS